MLWSEAIRIALRYHDAYRFAPQHPTEIILDQSKIIRQVNIIYANSQNLY
jgi:hypothetical protein